MKFLILLLLPLTGLTQKPDTVSILSGKVCFLVPRELKPITDHLWAIKYPNRPRPTMVLSDDYGEINLIANMTQQRATDDQLASFKDFQIEQTKKRRPDIEMLSDGMETINGKRVGYFKFITQAIDQKVFNYCFFTLVDGKVVLVHSIAFRNFKRAGKEGRK